MAAEAQIALQMQRIDTMRNMSNRLTDAVLATQGAAAIDAELAILTELWNRFNSTHERLYEDVPEIITNEYHTGNAYETANVAYTSLRVRLSAARPAPEPAHEVQPANHDQTAYFGGVHKSNLPQIKLPTFQGSYDEWDSFKDLFTSLVINEDSLTGSQKMHYLKTQVKGEAAALLANLQITDDAFQPAWELLNTRYTNPRRLLDMHIDDLLDRQPVTSHSAADLDALLLANKKSLDAIAALGIPIGELDPFLIRLTVRCLPSDLRVEWMASLGLSNDFPTYQQLHDVLKAKVRAWENSEIGATITSTQPKSASERPPSPKNYAKSAATTKQVKFGNSRPATSSTPSTSAGSASYVAFTPRDRTSEPGMCPICKEKHFVLFCPSYQKASPLNRRTIVQHYRLCFNCLGRHRYADCRTKQKCRHCDQPHHTSTHLDDGAAAKPAQDAPVADPAHSLNVLLATAIVKLNSLTGSTCTARVLIDQGSELSFVTHSLIKKLDIQLSKAAVPLRGIGNVSAGHSLGSCKMTLHSLHNNASITIQAHVLALLTVNLPSFTLTKKKKWPHITGLQLADPDFLTSRPIDIILGAAPAAHIINAKIRKGSENDPIAQSTSLGWIIYGSVDTATSKLTAHGHHVAVDDQLQDLLTKFWYQEEPQTEFATRYTEEEEECEQHFVNTHYRQSDGRYVVRLPLKSSPSQLGDSLRAAQYALLRLRKRLEADPVYKKLYFDFLKEYEDLGHMKRLKLKELPPNSYLLPHHGVLKEQSTTTKLRVVFNGSWKTTSGVSVNEILHVGPKIQVDISDVLIRIRCHRYLFATDVTKMFRQIAVDKEDHHLQCILWFDEDDIPIVFALATVTYGTTSAPYLAGRALLQLAEDEGKKFPKAVEPLTNTRYVDDIYGGADELAEAIQVALDTKNMCATGCFPLAKWASNSTELLSQVAPSETQEDTPRELGDTTVKVLGLTWNSTQDKFQFGYSLPEASPTTKRTILSEIARLFDPLGFLAPIIVRAKMFMQKLWLQNFDWDATLSPSLLQEWNLFRDELHQISKIQIPRWNHVKNGVSIELHGFSDASQLAMAAVVYLKVTDATGSSNISLVCAKTQVAPLKPITIPRMELNAAVLLAQLILYVKKVLKLENVPVFMWTDSAVSLTWIRNNPARWKVYIRNRVTKIQESLPSVNWDFVPGKLNPADCASRGLTAAKLEQHSLWWTGPKWLSQSKDNWPSFDIPTQTVSHLEERPGLVFTIFKADSHPLYTLLEKFSKLSPLLRMLGICLRAIAKFKKK
ncbi:uncharacterized protein LOC106693372 [Microplitis demolitor]|uniref:uncharacterized protein LOC106693372 n=1 Tax=Microplitis demolitor TaxID=69319 RepID=UPI00235B5E58|nr:uncharacterized protein LOC106693372 [Microplitis demolitor]